MKYESEIIQLINSKREGEFWDFKQEPHDNKASLLHDILCLSNCAHRGERFLILGVTDPDEGAEIIGLTKGDNRKSQVEYIDFLRSKHFAGDFRPEIELQTIELNKKEIDVLIIFDNPYKPYYLKQDYRDNGKVVKANFIYSRSNDTDTPIDKSADLEKIEKMWRQRFGLDLNPLERMNILLLKPEKWFKDIGNKPYAYNLDFPEFRIEFSEVKEFWETFSFFFTNHKSFLGTATFKYHSTILFELEYMYCDEMRLELAVPDTEHIKWKNEDNWFYYYNLEKINGTFLQFITDNLKKIHSRRNIFPFLIFRNKEELESFKKYVLENEESLDEIEDYFWGKEAKKDMKRQNKNSVIDPIFIDKINQVYDKWTWA